MQIPTRLMCIQAHQRHDEAKSRYTNLRAAVGAAAGLASLEHLLADADGLEPTVAFEAWRRIVTDSKRSALDSQVLQQSPVMPISLTLEVHEHDSRSRAICRWPSFRRK